MHPESAGRPARARRLLFAAEAALVALALIGAALLLVALAGFEYGLDQGIYAAVSDALLRGGAPYRDAWDFKPPGIFFVYALARAALGAEMGSVRVLEALAFASLVPAFAILARRFTGRVLPGLLGAAIAISGHVWLGFWHTAQPESFGAVLLAWALVAATFTPREETPGADRRQALAWALAGACYSLASLFKPPLGGGVPVGIAAAALATSGPRVSAWLRPTLAYGAGAALPYLAALLFFAAHGALPDLYEALFVYAPAYTAINLRTDVLVAFAYRAVEFSLFRFSLIPVTGLVLLFALPPLASQERRGAAHVLGVVAVLLAGVALQGRFFAYHFGAVLPLLALLGGIGLSKAVARWPRAGVPGLALLLVVLANAVGPSGEHPGDVATRLTTFETGREYNVPNRRAAAWLKTHTAPDDAIFVWGFDPALYELARRRPASRYVYNAPQRADWFMERARPLLLADLAATPPRVVVVQHGDVHPGTTGNDLDSAKALRGFPRLAAWLAANYEPAGDVPGFSFHLRIPEPRTVDRR